MAKLRNLGGIYTPYEAFLDTSILVSFADDLLKLARIDTLAILLERQPQR